MEQLNIYCYAHDAKEGLVVQRRLRSRVAALHTSPRNLHTSGATMLLLVGIVSRAATPRCP